MSLVDAELNMELEDLERRAVRIGCDDGRPCRGYNVTGELIALVRKALLARDSASVPSGSLRDAAQEVIATADDECDGSHCGDKRCAALAKLRAALGSAPRYDLSPDEAVRVEQRAAEIRHTLPDAPDDTPTGDDRNIVVRGSAPRGTPEAR